MTSLFQALRRVRSGRDKAAYYRMWQMRQRAGLSRPGHPAPWPAIPFEKALLTLGEESGKLEEVLRLLADYFQADDRLTMKVMQRAAYPLMTALAAAFIAPVPLMFLGIPGAYVLAVGGGLTLWAAASGGLVTGSVNRYSSQPRIVLARLLRSLTLAIEAGLPLGRAAALAAEASGNPEVVAHLRRVGAKASMQPLGDTFRGCPHVPFTALAALQVADASGDYSGTLKKLAELHDR